jgi:hypothetical protein
MTREELIKMVALKMDEISSSDDVIVAVDSSDNNPLYTQINGLLNESINDVLTKAPIYRLQNFVGLPSLDDEYTEDSTTYSPRKVVVFKVPSNFIRIASITDAAFKRPVVDLAIEGDETSKRQHNRFLIAKESKPVAVLGRDAEGNRVITCYSYSSSATIDPKFLYVKRYEDDTMSASIDLDDYLTDLVSWVCAGKVFATQGDVTKGKICDENAAALMV